MDTGKCCGIWPTSQQKSEDAGLQQTTYIEYYADNCFKGGVFVQLCGWLGNEYFWGGGVSDSDYNNRSGYLQEQQQFQEADLVFDADNGVSKIIPFLVVSDQGYRAKMSPWKHRKLRKQLTLQPPSSRIDERFREKKTVYATGIAHDWSVNERAVNVSKHDEAWISSLNEPN